VHNVNTPPKPPQSIVEQLFEQADAGASEVPMAAYWLVTNACNLKCQFCFASSGKRAPDEMSTDEIKAVLDDFARSGVGYVGLLGGEPLVRPDIFELVEHISDLGLSSTMISNGTLATRERMRRLRDAGLELFGTSMDGMTPAVHDGIRGMSGAHQRTMDAIRFAIEEGIRCSVRTVVTRENADEIPALFEWQRQAGVHEMILLSEFPLGRGAQETREATRAKAQEMRELYQRTLAQLRRHAEPLGIEVPPPYTYRHTGVLLRRDGAVEGQKAEFYQSVMVRGFERCRGCVIGKYFISPQPNGDVYPCPFLPVSIGNLRERSIRDLWRESELLQRVRRRELGGICGDCEIKTECGGCRARSYALTGDPYAEDPLCPRVSSWGVGLPGSLADATSETPMPQNPMGKRCG
jgi:radical SAM protein with 4Fe4S-binding SPASM domain